MSFTNLSRRVTAGFLLLTFVFLSVAEAVTFRPRRPFNPFLQDEEKGPKKLPPVNWIRSRNVDIKHLAIDLRFDWEKEQAYGSTVVTLTPLMEFDRFTLDAASMTINSVISGDGKPMQYKYDGAKDNDNLEIALDRVFQPGETIVVKVDYRTNHVNKADGDTAIGSFGKGLRFIKPTPDNPKKPRQIWSQGETEFNRYWFPSYDSPNDFRTTELRATVDKPYTVVSNGTLVETKENADNTRTFYWKMDTPYTNYLTSIVVGEYREVVQNSDGIPVTNYAYPAETKEVAATVKNLPATIKFFSDITGIKYPYTKYSQTFVEDFGGGMENITATTQIEEMIHDERELLDEDSESLQAHELAHQWFGNYVTCRDWGQIWLNESFATYLQAMWHEKLKGKDYFLFNDVMSNQQQALDTWEQGNRRPIITKYYANKDAMFDNYAYPRGGAVLHMLRKHLGDKAFLKALNHYLVSNAHQPVSTEDFRIAIEETSGQSMDWFFDQWLYKMGHPIFEVSDKWENGKLTLTVKQTQKIDILNEFPQVEFFQTFVDVEIDGQIKRVWIEPKAENTFTFDAATKPKLINFDHEGTLIKELTFNKSTEDLIYQAKNDKDVLGRHWAMTQLGNKFDNSPEKPRILTAIREMAGGDTSADNRKAALNKVQELIVPQEVPGEDTPPVKLDSETLALALKLLKDENSLIRAGAVDLLAQTEDVKHAGIYTSMLSDRSYSVVESAAAALGATKTPGAYNEMIKLANTPSWRDRIPAAGLSGLAELGDKRAFDLAFKMASDQSRSSVLRSAALRVVGKTGKGNPKAFPFVLGLFKKSLADGDMGMLFNSVQATIDLVDPKGQEVFDTLKEKFKDQPQMMLYVGIFEQRFKESVKSPK